jgi:dimethylargininase
MFKHAIVRPPAANFAQGLTTVDLGKPQFAKALDQHQRYCAMLQSCGLELTRLEADASFPDSTFVEDTAILTPNAAILMRPGAASREGEVVGIERALRRVYARFHSIVAPGTVDGGDVCAADGHYFIGISERTNAQGAKQLGAILSQEGFTSSVVDIRSVTGILHLKSGLSHLGDRRLLALPTLAANAAFVGYQIVPVPAQESYAANILRINGHTLISAGFPQVEILLRDLGYATSALEVSEFRKMDGSLTCLSLLF